MARGGKRTLTLRSYEARFYRTVITVEILGRDFPFEGDVADIAPAIMGGNYSGSVITYETNEVGRERMSQLLIASGSDPSFLGLNEDGTSTDAWERP